MKSIIYRLRPHPAVFIKKMALAVLITWPLVTVISTHFAGYPFGDAHEMTRHMWWMKHALQTGQSLIFQPLLAYPDGLQGVILWSDPLQFFPGWLLAFVLPLPAAYNVFVLLTLALNGRAAHWLVYRLTDQRPAALIGGLVFMAAPVMQGHLAGGHGGLLVQWPLPLLAYHLLALCNLLPEGDQSSANHQPLITHSILATLFFFLTPLGHSLQLIYAVMPLVAVLGVTVLLRRDWRALGRLIGVSAVGTVLLGLFLLPVFSATFGTSAYTAEGGGIDFSADLLGIFTPSFNHPLYGQLNYTHQVLGVNIVEGSSYVGIVVGLLAIIALWKARRARWWLGLAGAAWLLSLGPLLKVLDTPVMGIIGGYETRVTLPWALLYDLPGFSLARTPGRFSFLLALALAVMAGYGYAAVSQKLSAKGQSPGFPYSALGTALLMLLILFDYQSFWPLPTYDAAIPQPVYALAQRSEVRAVFDVPWDNLLAAKDALWLQTAHEKPMIAGQVTRRTPASPAKLAVLEQTLNPALLREAGADVVIVHKHYDTDGKAEQSAQSQLGAASYEDEQIALFDVPPDAGSSPDLQVITPPRTSTNTSTLYAYTSQPGWLNVYLGSVGTNPAFSLSVDDVVLREWPENTYSYEYSVHVPLPTAGYHTVTLNMSPACPEQTGATLRCYSSAPVMTWEGGAQGAFLAANFDAAVDFAGGLRLKAWLLTEREKQRVIHLWWQFDQPRSGQDIRFIKVLNEQGVAVASVDEGLGDHAAGSQWVESVNLDVAADLPVGTYSVYVGWYTYPDLTRFKVLSDVTGAVDGWALVGEFAVDSS
ncbi:MAG: hypothetical protein R3E39_15350 [Anaerolineae bacterium]